MLEALGAERIKLLRHRASWFLVWIFPIGVSAILIGVTIYQLIKGEAPDAGPPDTAAKWVADSVFPWIFPGNTLGRYLLAAFTAVAFGGEYGWNTWKLVAPHRGRVALLGAKYAVVLALFAVSLISMAVLSTVLGWANGVVTNDPVPEGIELTALLAANGRSATAALLAVLLTVAYASAGAVLTRSTLAGAIIAIVAITAESLIGSLGPRFLDATLFQIAPSYHLSNLQSWVTTGEGLTQRLPKGVVSLPWGWSLASYLLWTCGLIALAVAAFRRQDLN